MRPRSTLAALLLSAAALAGCTGGGCGGLAPFPDGGRFLGPRADQGLDLRLTAAGLAAVSASGPGLAGALAPGGVLHLPVACQKLSLDTGLPLVGVQDFYLADQGQADGGGRSDARCDGRDQPVDVAVTITSLTLVPRGGTLDVDLTVAVDTGAIYFTNPGFIRCDLACQLGFDSSASPSALTAVVRLSIDPVWDRLLAFSLTRLDGTQVCGSAGAPTPPACLDPAALSLASSPFGAGGLCLPVSWGCDLLGVGFLKDLLLQLLSPALQAALQGALAGVACQACGPGQPACPVSAGGTVSACGAARVCVAPDGGCVPRFLGAEGRLDLGGLVGAGGGTPAPIDVSLVAGGSVQVDTGLTVGTRVGVEPVTLAACVPPAPAPDAGQLGPPDFDAEAPGDGGYHLAVSLSSDLLGRFLWAAQQSGALCLQLTTATVSLLDTALLKTVLPSLGLLATAEGKDAPMELHLRPARPPTVTVGKGTLDPVSGAVLEPLLTLALQDLGLDFYALIADRQVRLFTLIADVSLPVGLRFDGCGQVVPVLGDLGTALSNVRAGDSELLAEDPAVLAALVPTLLAAARPALAGSLGAIALPAVAGFRLEGGDARGLGPIAGSAAYRHLAFFTRLAPADGGCAGP